MEKKYFSKKKFSLEMIPFTIDCTLDNAAEKYEKLLSGSEQV